MISKIGLFNRALTTGLIGLLCQGQALAAPTGKPAAINPLASAMGQAGVAFCKERVHQVADFLASGSNSGARLLMPTDYINDHMVSASLEVFNGSEVFYANMDFAPLLAYGCDASFETVVYWPDSCEKVAKVQFKQAKNTGKLRQHISLLTAGSNLQIFLMPAGAGCVSIKKQALFDRF